MIGKISREEIHHSQRISKLSSYSRHQDYPVDEVHGC